MAKSTRSPNEILNAYVSEKVLKAIPEFVKEELDVLDDNDLRKVVVQAHSSMKKVAEELAANEKYQQAKAIVDDLGQGKKDTDKYQKAKIAYCLARLEQMAKLDIEAGYELHAALRQAQAKLNEKRLKSKDVVKVYETGRVEVQKGPESSSSDSEDAESDTDLHLVENG